MANEPAGSLLRAFRRTRVPEDILTEMLAHVLASDPEFGAGFVDKVGEPGIGTPKILTQVVTPSGRRRIAGSTSP